MKRHLLSRIEDKSALIGIIGLGYVGLPLLLSFSEAGYRVLGFDTDAGKITKLKAGRSYIKHIDDSRVSAANATGLFEGSSDLSRSKEADALIICVPTPLNEHREPDLSFVINSVDAIVPFLRPGQVISLESTTYPGTTEEELLPRLETSGLKVGRDIFLLFSPEREDPGNINFSTRTIPKVCGGITPDCLDVGKALYSGVINQVVPVSCTKTAEMTKLLENIYRAVNIGLVNELKIVCDTMGIDIREVIDAASTKPFGYTPYYPGPGLGGHCIPIDPFYLTWKAREYGLNTRFIELAGEVNTAMPEWVIGKVMHALNDRGQALKGAQVLVLGIAYKKNVDDMRESPSVVLMDKLRKKGAMIAYSDPHVPVFPKIRKFHFDLVSVQLTEENLAAYDCVLIATNHDDFDYDFIHKWSQLIVDTRGVYAMSASKVVRA
jgi:UDP-N-acetyl-D-glucosamine dehydrogenase